MEQQMNYEDAYQELEAIYAAINNEEVSIDELALKVKRAAVLISFCQSRLKSTEEEVSKILSSIPEPGAKNTVENRKEYPSADSEETFILPF